MKRFLLTLILMAFAGFASAQSFTFEHDGKTVEPGRYEVIGNVDPLSGDMVFEFNIKNLTSDNINVQCDRAILSTSHLASRNSVCMGYDCFSYKTDHTYAEIEGNSEVEFSAHFLPVYDESNTYPIEGCKMEVQYSFYVNEGDEPVVITIYFEVSTVSVEDYSDTRIFSNAYPNPAKNMVSFDYDMTSNAQTASVAIYNMMGQEVIRQELNLGDSRVNINVSDLTDGIYFYSLIVNNQVVKTNKLVVSK